MLGRRDSNPHHLVLEYRNFLCCKTKSKKSKRFTIKLPPINVLLGGQESNLRTPGSKPGITTSSDDPGSKKRVPCGNRTRVASLEGWSLCRSAKGTWIKAEREGVEPSRLQEHRAGLEPASPHYGCGVFAARRL